MLTILKRTFVHWNPSHEGLGFSSIAWLLTDHAVQLTIQSNNKLIPTLITIRIAVFKLFSTDPIKKPAPAKPEAAAREYVGYRREREKIFCEAWKMKNSLQGYERLIKFLKEGKVVIGATVTAANPDVAATLAGAGFDFLWIEMEHGPLTLETARSMILATRGLMAMPFIRVPVNEPWMAKAERPMTRSSKMPSAKSSRRAKSIISRWAIQRAIPPRSTSASRKAFASSRRRAIWA